MKQLFSRKTFDPENHDDAVTLVQLRSQGAKRMRDRLPSTSLRWALSQIQSGVLIDCGCGDSADVLLASKAGFQATGFDLFPPSDDFRGTFTFVRTDVVDLIPVEANSVDLVICQAMMDLIEPSARNDFLKEANRVMKSGAIFCCYLQWLEPGWGLDVPEEIERAKNVWTVETRAQGYIGRKP